MESLPEGWPDRPLFQDLHRSGQGAGAQDHGQVSGFLIGKVAGDRGFPAADLVLNDRGGIDHSVQHDGQPLLDVFPGYTLKDSRPLGIKIHRDVGGIVLRIDADFGVGDGSTGEERPVLQDNLVFPRSRFAGVRLAHGVDFGSRRQFAFLRRLGTDIFGHQLEFEERGFPDEGDGSLRILDARKLNQDAVFSLHPNVRFAHPELVDPIADGLQRLAFRHLANTLRLRVLKRQVHSDAISDGFRPGNSEEGEHLLHDFSEFSLVLRTGQLDFDLPAFGVLDFDEGYLFRAQGFLEIVGKAFHVILDRFISLHFQHEVHAALKVETKMNLFLWQKTLPPGRQRGTQGGCQIDHPHDEDHHY